LIFLEFFYEKFYEKTLIKTIAVKLKKLRIVVKLKSLIKIIVVNQG